jgi:glycosyltransferase involved in cell wall biosynthesis
LKFTIITRYYHPTPDGIGHHSGYINQYLIKKGDSVQVIYDDGIVALEPKEIGILINKIKRQKSDWVIFQYNGYSYNRFGAPTWLAKLYKNIKKNTSSKLCLIVHETYIRKEDSYKLKIYRFLQKRALKIATKYADLIITTTNLYQQQLSEMGRNSEVFYTPSNFENYIQTVDYNRKENSILTIGTFGNRDPFFLLQVILGLEAKGLACKFLFIGNYQPKYVKDIKSFIKKLKLIEIQRSGKLTDSNIVKYLKELDAFILLEPVRDDGGGGLNTKSGASATALCMGIPVFSTKGDFTNEEVFIENENYICLDHQNVENTIEILYKNLSNSKNLKQIGENGKNLYESNFGWEQYVNNLKTIFISKENE